MKKRWYNTGNLTLADLDAASPEVQRQFDIIRKQPAVIGPMLPREYEYLETLVSPGIGIDIGTQKGDSARAMVEGARKKGILEFFHVVTIDPFAHPNTRNGWILDKLGLPDRKLLADANFREWGIEEHLTCVRAPSVDLACALAQESKRLDISLVLIDGDHTISSVREDYYAWKDMVRPGGYIVFHDYYDPTAWQEGWTGKHVTRFIDEVVRQELTKVGCNNRLVVFRR